MEERSTPEIRVGEVGAPGAPLKISGDVSHIIALAEPLEASANAVGIFNVFDDGGYRTLLMLTMFGLQKPPGRLGQDAFGPGGDHYELKTINLVDTRGRVRTTYPGITTEHTLRQRNVDRYRQARAWLIGIFRGNVPLEIWEVLTGALEPYYRDWELRIERAPNHEINNPKIPFGFIAERGLRHLVSASESIERPKPGRYRPMKGPLVPPR
jgi:hypothetical protein